MLFATACCATISFYRISTITIHVPPLRERMEDIQLLTDHFLKLYADKYDRSIAGVSQSAYQRLFSHPWPGNVRELQNVIERAILLAKSEQIEPVDLPFDNGSAGAAAPALAWDVPPNMTLEDIEKFVIERTLQRTGGNKQKAANLLGIYRPRLYSKIKKYKIGPESVSANLARTRSKIPGCKFQTSEEPDCAAYSQKIVANPRG